MNAAQALDENNYSIIKYVLP